MAWNLEIIGHPNLSLFHDLFAFCIASYQQEKSFRFHVQQNCTTGDGRIQLRKLVSVKTKGCDVCITWELAGDWHYIQENAGSRLRWDPCSQFCAHVALHLHKHTLAGGVRGHLRMKMTSFRLWNNQSSLQIFLESGSTKYETAQIKAMVCGLHAFAAFSIWKPFSAKSMTT